MGSRYDRQYFDIYADKTILNEIGGGKFANGAVAGVFVHMLRVFKIESI